MSSVRSGVIIYKVLRATVAPFFVVGVRGGIGVIGGIGGIGVIGVIGVIGKNL